MPPRRLYDGQPAPSVGMLNYQPYWRGRLYRTAFGALVPYGPGDYLTNDVLKMACKCGQRSSDVAGVLLTQEIAHSHELRRQQLLLE